MQLRIGQLLLTVFAVCLLLAGICAAQTIDAGNAVLEACPRPAAGSVATEPESVYSSHGTLNVTLFFRSSLDESEERRYCYVAQDNAPAPALHVLPGDEVFLTVVNQVRFPPSAVPPNFMEMQGMAHSDCAGGRMDPGATNLHFHGLDLAPSCHQDDVLNTLIRPKESFTYHFRIPIDEPPGLYWYHPHVHGFSEEQVQGGASGALIVDGIDRAVPEVRNLRHRVLVLRDQPLREGGRPRDRSIPAWDISLNSVPVIYPEYRPAVLYAKPESRELWRVLNAAADSHFDLQLLKSGAAQPLMLVGLDGVPLQHPRQVTDVVLPPGGRAEFIAAMPEDGAKLSFVTRAVDTGPLGDTNPARPIAEVVGDHGVPTPLADPEAGRYVAPQSAGVIVERPVVRHRLFYFSQRQLYPNDPKSPTEFYLTEEGKTPEIFDMAAFPKISIRNGNVEEWTIENRAPETHDFHIHQLHFKVLARNGVKLAEEEVRDTMPIQYWDGVSPRYPSVTLRVDFSCANCVGTILFHCHMLEHEDAGMMSSIEVTAPDERQDRPGHSQ